MEASRWCGSPAIPCWSGIHCGGLICGSQAQPHGLSNPVVDQKSCPYQISHNFLGHEVTEIKRLHFNLALSKTK